MKIKIIKCGNKEWWYNSLVGKVLTAAMKNGHCVAAYSEKRAYNTYSIVGYVEPEDYQEATNGKESE